MKTLALVNYYTAAIHLKGSNVLVVLSLHACRVASIPKILGSLQRNQVS